MSDWFQTGYDAVQKEAAKSYQDEFRVKEHEGMPGAAPGSPEAQGVLVRFLSEEPKTFRQHTFRQGTRWPRFTCRGAGCPMCNLLHDSPRFVGAFTVYDYRDGKVKVYLPGIRVLRTLDRFRMMEGGLTGHDWLVMRSGAGTDSTYNFLPRPASDFPAGAKNPDGTLQQIDIIKAYAPLSQEELTQKAMEFSSQSNPPPMAGQPTAGQVPPVVPAQQATGQQPPPQQPQDGAFTGGVKF